MTERATGKNEGNDVDGGMEHRTITLADGRYLIFYTFADDPHRSESNDSEKEEDV